MQRRRKSMSGVGEHQEVETHVLKVHLNCLGCQRKVKKLLRKIHGVYTVHIDPEQELVTVTGTVDSDVIIHKLVSIRKHAELCLPHFQGQEGRDKSMHKDANYDINSGIPPDTPWNKYLLPTLYDPNVEYSPTNGNDGCRNAIEKALMEEVDATNLNDYGCRDDMRSGENGRHQNQYSPNFHANLPTYDYYHLNPTLMQAHPNQSLTYEMTHGYDQDKIMMHPTIDFSNNYF